MKYAIRVLRTDPATEDKKCVGYLGAFKPGETRLRGTGGKLSDMTVRPVESIKDTSYIPYWTTRQECLKALARLHDDFFNAYGFLVEKL